MVQYIVKVPDVDRFVATSDKYGLMMEEMAPATGPPERAGQSVARAFLDAEEVRGSNP
jgi:hypothetical protein